MAADSHPALPLFDLPCRTEWIIVKRWLVSGALVDAAGRLHDRGDVSIVLLKRYVCEEFEGSAVESMLHWRDPEGGLRMRLLDDDDEIERLPPTGIDVGREGWLFGRGAVLALKRIVAVRCDSIAWDPELSPLLADDARRAA